MTEDVGTGFLVDYAKTSKTVMTDKTLSWLGDFGFFHKGFEGDASLNTFMITGGPRVSGKAGAKATWLGQGTLGFMRSSAGGDNSACDVLDIDCSDTTGVVKLGGAIEYPVGNGKNAVRGGLQFVLPFEGYNAAMLYIQYVFGLD